VLQPSDNFCGSPLDTLPKVRVCPVLRAPELDARVQVDSENFQNMLNSSLFLCIKEEQPEKSVLEVNEVLNFI